MEQTAARSPSFREDTASPRPPLSPKTLIASSEEFQLEQTEADLAAERSVYQKLENQRAERQNKEFRDKMQELEGLNQARTKSTFAAMESNAANIERQPDQKAKWVVMVVVVTFVQLVGFRVTLLSAVW